MLIKRHIQEKFSYIDVKEILNAVRNCREEVNNFEIVIHYSYYSRLVLSEIPSKSTIASTNPRFYITTFFRTLMRKDLIRVSGVEVRSYAGYGNIWGKTIFSKFYKETC